MKTIILLRHSQPQKGTDLPNELIPLSDDGTYFARKLFQNVLFQSTTYVYSSPYRRAFDTAVMLGQPVTTDLRLVERQLGDPTTLRADFWKKQYLDHTFKNCGGESLNEVNLRMTSFVDELLSKLSEGQTAVVVSHAAAICSYLLNFCTITVTNSEAKLRKICFGRKVVMDGAFPTPGGFILQFQNRTLANITCLK